MAALLEQGLPTIGRLDERLASARADLRRPILALQTEASAKATDQSGQ